RADAPPRADAFGDPLPPRVVLRIGTTRLGHANRLDHVALTADGKSLATAATFTDPSVCVWDTADGKRRFGQDLPPRTDALGVTLSAAGGRLTVVVRETSFDASATLLVWDVATGKELLKLPLGKWTISRRAVLALSPDGKTLVVAGRDVAVVDLDA